MNDFYEKLDSLYDAGDPSAVESFIIDAVSAAQEGSFERAGLYNELAGLYRGLNRFAESEEAFFRALDVFEAGGMEVSEGYATVLVNLAGLYRINGQADKVVNLYNSAIKKIEDVGASDSYAYISILNNLALACQEIGEYFRALEYAGKALTLMRGGVSDENEIAASLSNLAVIHLNLGELDAADQLIAEALAIYDGMTEPDVHHAAALTTKAVISCRAGYHYGALDGFRRALELTRQFFGENIEFAACKRNISDVYELLGDIPSAVMELTDAARILESILGPDHPSFKEALNKLEILRRTSRSGQ